MIEFKNFSLLDSLPPNLLQDEKVQHLAEVITKQNQRLATYAEKLNYAKNLRELPEAVIDHLLWEKHLYNPSEGIALAKTFEEKVNLVEAAIDLHQHKGTPYAIERVMQAINVQGEVLEWFEYGGDPYHFKVEIDTSKAKADTLRLLRSMVMEYKNTRSILEMLAIRLPQEHYIEMSTEKHTYPVYLPICGEIHCEGMPGVQNAVNMELTQENYNYPVHLPITGEIHANEVMDEW